MKNELYHHGILGMHWGKRNGPPYPLDPAKDYSPSEKKHLTDEQLKKVQDKFDDDSVYDGSKKMSKRYFKAIGANEEALKDARKILKQCEEDKLEVNYEARKLFKGLNKEATKLDATAEIANDIAGGWAPSAEEFTLDDFVRSSFSGVWDDGGQGDINRSSLYAYKKNIARESDEIANRYEEIEDAGKKAAKVIVDDALNKIGDERVKTIKRQTPNYSYSVDVANKVVDELNEIESNRGFYIGLGRDDGYLDAMNGSYAKNFDSNDKKAIQKAEKWVSNIKYNNEDSTWWILDEAIDGLHMGNMKCDEMTKADWKRINDWIDRKYGRDLGQRWGNRKKQARK